MMFSTESVIYFLPLHSNLSVHCIVGLKSNEHCITAVIKQSKLVTIYCISDGYYMFGVQRLSCHGLVFHNEVIVHSTDSAASWSRECFSLRVILLYH